MTETHRSQNIGWLRAAVLGANDGIVSTASLILGVAAANSSHKNILLTGIAGLVAGGMSMAAGEYVSVGAALPLLMVVLSPPKTLFVLVSMASLLFLILLDVLAAMVGGASIWRGAFRVGFWGAIAMAVTAAIVFIFDTIV